MRKLAVSLAVAALMLFAAPASVAGASIDPAYPPTTTTTFIPPTFFSNFEIFLIGTHFTIEACGFMPNTTAQFTYNGPHLGVFVVDKAGCITIKLNVFDPHVTINGGPLEPANWTGNTIVATDTGANTAQRTYTLIFNILQPGGSQNNQGGNQGGNGQGNQNGGTQGGGPAASGPGSLAFTGSNLLATAIGGLAMLVAGTLLVVLTRRRSQRNAKPLQL
jgi:hypothetical protein